MSVRKSIYVWSIGLALGMFVTFNAKFWHNQNHNLHITPAYDASTKFKAACKFITVPSGDQMASGTSKK